MDNIVKKASVLIGGGLGDCIWGYFTSEEWKKLLSVKLKNNLHVTCYVHSLNDQAIDLVKLNPHVNQIVVEPYMVPVSRDVPSLKHVFDLQQYDEIPMPIYLTLEENLILEKVKSHGEYIVIHPFAGEEERVWKSYVSQVVHSIVKRNFNVVIVGGNSIRKNYESITENIEEEFPRTFNFVNNISVRLCCELIRNCKYFIGSHSCYLTAAWGHSIPAMCITNDCLMGYMIPHENGCVKPFFPNVSKLCEGKNHVVFFSQMVHFDRFLDNFLSISRKIKGRIKCKTRLFMSRTMRFRDGFKECR